MYIFPWERTWRRTNSHEKGSKVHADQGSEPAMAEMIAHTNSHGKGCGVHADQGSELATATTITHTYSHSMSILTGLGCRT
jgi:hypothetical protein